MKNLTGYSGSATRCTFAVLLVAVLTWSAQAQPQAPQQLALITDMGGTILVKKAGEDTSAPARWGMPLYEGDQVQTQPDARVALLFANNNLITLGPSASLTISSNASAPGEKVIQGPMASDIAKLTLTRTREGEVAALGGLRSGQEGVRIELIAPRHSRMLEPRPTFVWQAPADFEAYRVRVFDQNGLVWEGETEGAAYTYPAEAPALMPDQEYRWQVEGEDLLDSVKSPIVPFSILSPSARKDVLAQEAAFRATLQGDDEGNTLHFMLGAYYAQEGLLTLAIQAFEHIAEQHPAAALPHEILGKLYSEVGLKDEAIRAFKHALVLNQK